MGRQRLPVDGRTPDWPRKVADAVRYAQGDIESLEARADALEVLTDWSALADYADDTAAASGGVAVGALYRTGSAVKVRVS